MSIIINWRFSFRKYVNFSIHVPTNNTLFWLLCIGRNMEKPSVARKLKFYYSHCDMIYDFIIKFVIKSVRC